MSATSFHVKSKKLGLWLEDASILLPGKNHGENGIRTSSQVGLYGISSLFDDSAVRG
jgi:hypothetical protein